MRFIFVGEVAPNIKGKVSSVPVASFQGLKRHHFTRSITLGTRRPGQKKENKRNKIYKKSLSYPEFALVQSYVDFSLLYGYLDIGSFLIIFIHLFSFKDADVGNICNPNI